MGKNKNKKNKTIVNYFSDSEDDTKNTNIVQQSNNQDDLPPIKKQNSFLGLVCDSDNDNDVDNNDFIPVKNKHQYKKQEIHTQVENKQPIQENITQPILTQQDISYYIQGLREDKKNNFNKAVELYLKSIENKESCMYKAAYNLALTYEDNLNDSKNAIKYYELACDGNHVLAHRNLALLYDDMNYDYDTCVKAYKKAIIIGDFTSLYNIALYLDKNNRKDYALECLTQYQVFKNADEDTQQLYISIIDHEYI